MSEERGVGIRDVDGVKWFEARFGVPIGDRPGARDVKRMLEGLHGPPHDDEVVDATPRPNVTDPSEGLSSRWRGSVSGEDGPSDSMANMLVMLSDVRTAARAGNLQEVDALLEIADPFTLSELSALILLRGTSAFRNELKNWASLRDGTIVALTKRGVDARKALAGLLT